MPLRLVAVVVLAFVLFFVHLGATSLWDPDEPRQAIMAREMMDRGDYIHPYLNGSPYLEKPPFYSWMIIVAAKIQGSLDEFAARVPSAVAATLLLFVAFYLGTVFVDANCGLLCAFTLATNYQYLSNARESVMDMTFAFFIGLTICLNYVALSRRNRLFFILSFIPSALAILTKGPAGLVIPAAVTFIYLLVCKEWKRYILPLAAGCVLSVALASIWFLLAGPEYIREFIVRQNVTRYTNAFDHAESVFYYFHKIFVNFLPWSIALPFALVHAWRKKYWLPVVWFAFTFLFFELSQSKRAIYLLSAYPACALLCGMFLRDKWQWIMEQRLPGLALKVFAAMLVLLPLGTIVALPLMPSSGVVGLFKTNAFTMYAYLALMGISAILFAVMVFKRDAKASAVYFFVYLMISTCFYNFHYMPLFDGASKSLKLITNALEPYKKTMEFYTLGFNSAGIIYYIGKPIHMTMKVADLNRLKDRNILLIVEEKRGRDYDKELYESFEPIKRVKYEKDHYTLYVRKNG